MSNAKKAWKALHAPKFGWSQLVFILVYASWLKHIDGAPEPWTFTALMIIVWLFICAALWLLKLLSLALETVYDQWNAGRKIIKP